MGTSIEEIKQNVDLLQTVQQRGIELKKQGQDWVGHCPFHEDKTPSFNVTPAKNLWHCFGCNKGGSVIDFVMLFDQVDLRDALASLNASPTTPKAKKPKESKPTPTPSSPQDQSLMLDVVRHYHETLLKTPTALAYLQKRGLNHPDLLQTFQIGFANRNLNQILPKPQKHKPEPIREKLKASGILRDTGFEHFRGCLTIPIFQPDGQIGEIYGRRINKERVNHSPHLYLPGPHQGVFNLSAIGHESPLILCEAILDALTFWVHGFRHVTASFGANGFTDELFALIQSKGIKQVHLAYDNDSAGNTAADQVAQRLIEVGIVAERLLLPKGQDVNDFALKSENAQTALASLLKAPQSYQPFFDLQQTQQSLPAPRLESPKTWDGQQMNLELGDRCYRIRGVDSIRSLNTLKVQLKVSQGDPFFLDTLDLTSHRQRTAFVSGATDELNVQPEVIKKDLGRVLLEVEGVVEYLLQPESETDKGPPPMSMAEMNEAMSFLQQPDLLKQILKDFETIGLVGEETNKLVGYLAAISRKLDDPLAVLVQSSSSAGKTTLMDGILNLVPPEDGQKFTTLTGQSLYYVEENQLVHKLLAVAEEEGVEKATYPLKILQSEKELRIATTVKDPKTGEFKVQNKCAKGPCAILLTTTAADIDEELTNRFILLTVNEDRQQTQAIHQKQRQAKTLNGLKHQVQANSVIQKHQNAQRLLQPIPVLNPYAEQLTFFSEYLRSRRDHKKYLGLIDTITFLHQHQRPRQTATVDGEEWEYIEASLEDIQQANRLITEVLGRCLDELAPQSRRLLRMIWEMVQTKAKAENVDLEDVWFTRKSVRDYSHWSDNQLKVHLKRLEDLEYLLAHQGGRGQCFIYELLWRGEGEDGKRFLPGVVDPQTLQKRA